MSTKRFILFGWIRSCDRLKSEKPTDTLLRFWPLWFYFKRIDCQVRKTVQMNKIPIRKQKPPSVHMVEFTAQMPHNGLFVRCSMSSFYLGQWGIRGHHFILAYFLCTDLVKGIHFRANDKIFLRIFNDFQKHFFQVDNWKVDCNSVTQ